MLFFFPAAWGQEREDFESFRRGLFRDYGNERARAIAGYTGFRDSLNMEYTRFLRDSWGKVDASEPKRQPVKDFTLPPLEYDGKSTTEPVDIHPFEMKLPEVSPRPSPIAPFEETVSGSGRTEPVKFYGIEEQVRLPEEQALFLGSLDNSAIADAWEKLNRSGIDNTISDCLRIRDKYDLCDWAYLQLLESVGKAYGRDRNEATLLMALLYSQSGYQMRIGKDRDRLILLFGSLHKIYEKGYYIVDGISFYPYGDTPRTMEICRGSYPGETPMSLLIEKEQRLGGALTAPHTYTSSRYPGVTAVARVPEQLLAFYTSYPTSSIGDNPVTRWAIYANTPLAQATRETLYPQLREALQGSTKLDAANRLLNWVQTGFEYAFDSDIWGEDRAFFAEETLFYPYNDCEDRSILFSRLVRDLLGLEVALVYYPDHLATAVRFDSEVEGATVTIDGKKFVVCDPTFVGAPVGRQMPNLDHSNVTAVILQ